MNSLTIEKEFDKQPIFLLHEDCKPMTVSLYIGREVIWTFSIETFREMMDTGIEIYTELNNMQHGDFVDLEEELKEGKYENNHSKI